MGHSKKKSTTKTSAGTSKHNLESYGFFDINALKPHPKNYRVHTSEQIRHLAASIKANGFYKNVVATFDGTILAGHGVVEAAKSIGMKEVPTVFLEIEPNDARALKILAGDNLVSRLAEDDDAILSALLKDLSDSGDDLLGTGYDEKDLSLLLSSNSEQKEVDQDEVPEPPDDPITKTGDLIILGRHRVLCGDSRSEIDVDNIVNGATINVAFTSPPYASQRKYDESSGFKTIHPDSYVDWFDPVQSIVAKHLAYDGSWFVNIKEHCEDGQRSLYVKDLTTAHVRRWGWEFIDEFAWTKQGVPGKWPNRFKNAWEPVFHFASTSSIKMRQENVSHASNQLIDYHKDRKETHSGFISGSAGVSRDGMALPSNVIRISNSPKQTDTGDVKHEASFPVALPSFFIKAFSDESDIIYDPFLGSGTTLIAAEQLNRTCYGMEISPAYCDVIVERWENLTGEKASRVGKDG